MQYTAEAVMMMMMMMMIIIIIIIIIIMTLKLLYNIKNAGTVVSC